MRFLLLGLTVLGLLFSPLLAQAEGCGVCHSNHFSEWQQSPHALAWRGESFQAQLKTYGGSETCGRCHAPATIWKEVNLRNEAGEQSLVPEQAPETKAVVFEPELAGERKLRKASLDEGVTCDSCHQVEVLRPTSKASEFVGPYHTTEGHSGKAVGDFRSFKLCGACHGRPLEEYKAPKGGVGYFHESQVAFTLATGGDCAGCHMPRRPGVLVQLRAYKNLPERELADHRFGGPRFEELANGLGMSCNLAGATAFLELTNVKLGHPLKTSPSTKYRLEVALVANGKRGEPVSIPLENPERLLPGSTLQIPLPFPADQVKKLSVSLFVTKGAAQEVKAFEREL